MLIEPDVHAEAKFWLEIGDAAIKFVALLVGAAWTWMNYLRSRTFKPKPSPEVSARLFAKDGEHFLSISCALRNVGQSKYEVKPEGTACLVWALIGSAPLPEELVWASDVFKEHKWMEPGEIAKDALLIRVPDPPGRDGIVGLRVGLRIVSNGVEYNTSCIVDIPDEDRRTNEGGI